MASERLATGSGTRPKDALAAYLSDLAVQLNGPRRRRDAILTELRDGLEQATEDRIATGLAPDRAAAAATSQFGSPHAVAGAFAGELATAYARRTIACFLATGPLVGICWLLLLHPRPWHTGLIALVAAIPVIPVIIAAIATAGGTLATTGRLMRWLPETGPRRALAATVAVATLCMIIDFTVITMITVSATSTRPLMIIACAASLIRIVCSITTVLHASLMRV